MNDTYHRQLIPAADLEQIRKSYLMCNDPQGRLTIMKLLNHLDAVHGAVLEMKDDQLKLHLEWIDQREEEPKNPVHGYRTLLQNLTEKGYA